METEISSTLDRAIEAIRSTIARPLRSVYLSGSRANGYAIPTSDIDVYFVFDGAFEPGEAKEIDARIRAIERP